MRCVTISARCGTRWGQGVDTSGPETKGTVLIKSAEELESYSKCVRVCACLCVLACVCLPVCARTCVGVR
jgi:hypothetical protein